MLDDRQRRAINELIRSITISVPEYSGVLRPDFSRAAADTGQPGIEHDQLPDD